MIRPVFYSSQLSDERQQNRPNQMTTTDTAATFATRSEALNIVAGLDSATYYLAHGEYERPTYTVRKVRGGSKFYIHARRFYYSGTFNARPSGPLHVNSNELY